jgi:hypothetical protein
MSAATWPVSQLVARLLMFLGPVAGLFAAVSADIPPPGWFAALVVAMAVGWAYFAESMLGTLCLALVLAWWGSAGLTDLPAEALVAALGLLVAHLAAVVVSYGPPEMAVDGAVALLWLARGAAVFVAAPMVWLLAELLEGRPEPPGVWIAAMTALVVAAGIAAAAFGPIEEEPG